MHDYQNFTALLAQVSQNLSRFEMRREHAATDIFDLMRDFERLGAQLQRLRASTIPADLRRQAEDTYSALWSRIAIRQSVGTQPAALRWVDRYRLIWRAYLPVFVLTVSLFVMTVIVGLMIGLREPDYVSLIVPQELLEQVLDQHAWFESIQDSPLLTGLQIAWNNIRVALSCFIMGALLGLGGIYLLCFNGLYFGAIFGYCLAHDFGDALGRFVLAHGPLELSIIVCSSFASLVYGRAFFTRPLRNFPAHFREGAGHAGTIALGVIPWLILAAVLEAFLSPFPAIPFNLRLTLGLVAAAAFWTWTFWPVTLSTRSN